MPIYTKTGDSGNTSVGKRRCPKDCPEAEVIGELDELASLLGVIAAEMDDPADLERIMSDIFSLNAHIMSEGKYPFSGNPAWLEKRIDEIWAEVGDLHHFILRFTDPLAAEIHYARAICRRAERRLITFAKGKEWLDEGAKAYINRLSDYLFALARWVNRKNGGEERKWAHK
ncbi:MAG: cob(I)yrinic acid a,c-diamide adenosyltransferase [Candidatus Diapherotrites archaeon]|nr:cob(I)yrinic acid a,c-diamide adenosyltransferase [Candidatus Diapherotrites archaeon]